MPNIFTFGGSASGDGGGGISFPYKITVNTSGIDGVNPVICYGDDGTSACVMTFANAGGAYTWTITATNCEYEGNTLYNYFGNCVLLREIVGDVVVDINWSTMGGFD